MANQELKYNFKDKNLLILGGSGLIGKSLLTKLINCNPKSITNFDVSSFKIKYKNYNFIKFDFEDITNFKYLLEKNYGTRKIDVMINTLYPRYKNWGQSNFENITNENLNSHLILNSNSFFWSSKVVAELMKKHKSGSIILMNSIYGLNAQDLSVYKNTPIKENMTYSIVKGALSNLVKQMASYYGEYNIRINSICSGGIMGLNSMTNNKLSNKFISNYKKKCPMGRLANVNEVVEVILFLSSKSSSYITGVNLPVDGGWTAI